MKRNFYTNPRPKEDSLDFGELDELLDDIDCYDIDLHFKDKKLHSVTAHCEGGINDHIMGKMKDLYNLRIAVIDPVDEDSLRLFFYYQGKYLNKAEDRKRLENELNATYDTYPKFKIKEGMEEKYKALNEELKKYQ